MESHLKVLIVICQIIDFSKGGRDWPKIDLSKNTISLSLFLQKSIKVSFYLKDEKVLNI